MPTYEYECKKCGSRFEVFQSMSDEPVKKCPECGKQVRRLVSGGAGVIFKGSGFYVTDKQEKATAKSAAEKKKEKKVTSNDSKALESKQKETSTVMTPPPQPPAPNE